MDFEATLKTIDGLAGPQTVDMTLPQFEAYVTDQLQKAKAEMAEEDEEKKAKAKKRLAHVRAVVADLSKASWDGTNGTKPIPVQNDSVTRDSEKSEKDVNITSIGDVNTAGDGQGWAAGGSQQSFGKSLGEVQKALEGTPAIITPAAPPPAKVLVWPMDMANRDSIKEDPATWNRTESK